MSGRIALMALTGLLAAGSVSAAAMDDLMAADRAWSSSTESLEEFMTYWAKGGSMHAPGAATLTGADALREFASGLWATPGFGLHWIPTKAVVSESGELGYTAGTYEMTMNGPDGKPAVDRGKYVTVWVKQDGKWKVMEDIFNSSAAGHD